MWHMSEGVRLISIRTVYAKELDFLFLLGLKSVKEVIRTTAVPTPDHLQRLSGCRIKAERHKAPTWPKVLFINQNTLHIMQFWLRNIKYFLIKSQYS